MHSVITVLVLLHGVRRARLPLLLLVFLAGLGLGGNESYPDVFAPFGGFSDETPVEDSQVGLHQCTGVGFEEKQNLISTLRAATET